MSTRLRVPLLLCLTVLLHADMAAAAACAAAGTDTDGDGLDDVLEDFDNSSDCDDDDTDADGIPNYLDIDDDGDSITTATELMSVSSPLDSDSDGTLDCVDLDSDNDGIRDDVEANDVDRNGIRDVDPLGSDTDGDGLDDAWDTDSGGTAPALSDADGDGLPDYRDPDDDGDGTLTVSEDTNGNGDWSDDDADGDGTPDYLDARAGPFPLSVVFADDVGDADPPINVDLTRVELAFDPATGDYELTWEADPAFPFVGTFRLNANLYNPDTGSNAQDPAFFNDTFNDITLSAPLTVVTLFGNNPRLTAWAAGDRVTASCPAPIGCPTGVGGFLSAVGPLSGSAEGVDRLPSQAPVIASTATLVPSLSPAAIALTVMLLGATSTLMLRMRGDRRTR